MLSHPLESDLYYYYTCLSNIKKVTFREEWSEKDKKIEIPTAEGEFHCEVQVNGLTASDWQRLKAAKSSMNGETDETKEVIRLRKRGSGQWFWPCRGPQQPEAPSG